MKSLLKRLPQHRRGPTLASAMVLLALILSLLALTTCSAFAAAGNPLFGWTIGQQEGWTHGSVKGYFEEEYIPFKYEGNRLAAGATETVTVYFDYKNGSVLGIDQVKTEGSYKPLNSSQTFHFGVAGAQDWSVVSSGTTEGGGSADTYYYVTWEVAGNNAPFTITFGAHLARGSHAWSGASLQVRVGRDGDKTVSIMVNEILYHDLSFSKTVNNGSECASAHEGDSVVFTLTASDAGNYGGSAIVTDTLPAGLQYVGVTSGPQPSTVTHNPDGSTTLVWNISCLGTGSHSFAVTFEARVLSGSHADELTNVGVLEAPGADPVRDTACVRVLHPDISVTKSADTTHAQVGQTVTYTITVRNTGNCALTAHISDPLLGIDECADLDPGDTWTTTAAVIISDDDPTTLRNIVTVTAEDDLGFEVTATASFDLHVNHRPDAVDDSATTDEDAPVVIDVLSNDTDVDGDTLSVVSVSDPAHGSATINEDGTVTYTPDPDFNGVDTFTYTITDGNGGSDTATVTVTVRPVNDGPDAVDDSATTDEDTSVTIPVLANDTDPDGDTLSVVSVSDPAHGSVTVNPDGTVTYTPDPDFNGVDTFTYTITDGNGGSDTATVTVTVRAGPVTSISGYVFLDANGNGVLDAGEGFIPGIVVSLLLDGTVVATTTSDNTGYYEFTDLEPGTYTVSIDVPLEYDPTTPTTVDVSATSETPGRADFGLALAPVLPYTPETPALPFTGPNGTWYASLLAALMSLLTGFMLIIRSLRKTR